MRDVVLVDAVRTPIGRRNGSLAEVHPTELSAAVLSGLVRRTGLDVSLVDEVVWGCVTQIGDQAGNSGRWAVLAAGWPETVPAVTVDRACGSSQQAIDFAAAMVSAGHHDVVIAGGVESMSRVPIGSARAIGDPFGPAARQRYPGASFSQGEAAELMAEKWALTRTELDAYSLESHRRAAAAIDTGAFDDQALPVATGLRELARDEAVRRDTTFEKLSGLKPSFRPGGLIHAGNSSQIADGAAAVLLMTRDHAVQLGLSPLVRYAGSAVTGTDPVLMLDAPITAAVKALDRAGVALHEVGAFEVNEAFASVPLAWMRELGVDHAIVNPLGGAIAVGHPLGASGAILMTRLAHHMRDRGIRYGLQTMCEFGGLANATVLELVEE